jgi:hypothetical protein
MRGFLLLLALASASARLQWQPDKFLISAWVDPVVPPSDFAAQYATFAAAGFTTLLGGFGATTPSAVAASLAAAAAAGLEALPSACESAAGPGPNGTCVGLASPALRGFQMYDEPSVADFPALSAWAASVAARAPGALRFINLLPNYASAGALGASTYGAYLAEYVATVRPDMLCFDHYPVFGPGSASATDDNATMAGYLRNLATVRAVAAAAGLPFFNFFGAMPFNGRADISESQLRWQAFSSLAHGASGVLYFCYWSPEGADFAWASAIMTPRAPLAGGAAAYAPGPHYAQAARINAKLAVLGSFLLRAHSTAVFAANGTGSGAAPAPAAAAPVLTYGGSGAGPAWSLLAGAFDLPAAAAPYTHALLLTNQDPDAPTLATLTLAAGAEAAAFELDAATGAVTPALDDAPDLPGWQLAIEAGDARLLVFEG